jgi:hypothetical protein
MILKQYYLGCLAHASYLLGDEATSTAIIVDPQRDIHQYLVDAGKFGLEIRHVFLTHFHADFVAGHLELRDHCDATIRLGARAKAEYAFVSMKDGDTLEFPRHSSRLATASLFLFRRRCLVARSVSLPTPSPYSLQGMSEKIHFQRFIRQHPLQLGDLPTQDQLAGSRMGRVYFFESVAPVVKQSSRYPKLSRKPEYVVAGLHPLESLASKFVTVSLPFLSLHFAAPF